MDEHGNINLDYPIPDVLVPDKTCADTSQDGHLTMGEVYNYAGLTDKQCANQYGCKVSGV